MLENDILGERRGDIVRIVPFLLRLKDIVDTGQGYPFYSSRKEPSQTADRPDKSRIVRDENQEFSQRDIPVNRLHRAQGNDGENLQAGDQIADAPVRAQHIAQLNPQVGKPVILLIKPINFVFFPSKGSYYPNARQILLYPCGELPLRLVRHLELLANFGVKKCRNTR